MKIKRRHHRLLAIAAVALVLFHICSSVVATSKEEIESNSQLNSLVEQLKSQKTHLNMTKKTIAGLEKELSKADEETAILDAGVLQVKNEIAETEAQLAQAEQDLEDRLRVMYMFGISGYFELLFDAENFTDLLTRIDRVKNVLQEDRDRVNRVLGLLQEKHAKISDVEAIEATQQQIREEKEQLLEKYKKIYAQLKVIFAAELQACEALAKTFGFSLNGYNFTGDFAWPIEMDAEGAFDISSTYGERYLAITGEAFHTGLDIAAKDEEPVLAVADGTVELGGPYGSGGICVVINHGQNEEGKVISSLYAHLSRVAVKSGDTVSQGDVIGYVGMTGTATGPHLHLEVWENGEHVDPVIYYPELSDEFNYL